MFFLQELDIGLNPCLTGVQEMDDARVLVIMGLHAKAQRDRAVTSRNPRINDGFDQTAMFPIGPNPTWTKFKQAIADNPMVMMKEWTFPSRFNHFGLVAAKLFCTFTTQIWMMVAKEALKGIVPTPTSLSDSMRCWTIISVDDTLTGTMFEACNVGPDNAEHTSHGRQGPRSKSFSDRMEIFFPSSESPPRKDSQWSTYWDGEGYIKKYHDILHHRDQEEKDHLNESLLSIFSELQCLPASQKITKKSKGFVWKCKNGSFVFVTNPKFYKIESLSKESKQARTTKGKVDLHIVHRRIKSKKVFAEELWRSGRVHGLASNNEETDKQKRRALQKRLSTSAKNKRKPPTSRGRGQKKGIDKKKPLALKTIKQKAQSINCESEGNIGPESGLLSERQSDVDMDDPDSDCMIVDDVDDSDVMVVD